MKSIIIIDNEEQICNAVKDLLEGQYEVVSYTDKNLIEALADIFTRYKNGKCFDLAIFDCLMKINGTSIAIFLAAVERASITKCKMPIVFFSAYDGLLPELKDYKVWQKPQDVRHLAQLIKEFIGD